MNGNPEIGILGHKRYGTHLGVLRYLLDNFDVRRVLEFGVGRYSTTFFLSRGVFLTSVDTDENWLKRFRKIGARNHRLILHPNDNVQLVLCGVCKDDEYDLALVDGPRATRWICVNELIGRARIIVVHDTDAISYGWHRISVPDNFRKLDYRLSVPWTSVITADPLVITKACEELMCVAG